MVQDHYWETQDLPPIPEMPAETLKRKPGRPPKSPETGNSPSNEPKKTSSTAPANTSTNSPPASDPLPTPTKAPEKPPATPDSPPTTKARKGLNLTGNVPLSWTRQAANLGIGMMVHWWYTGARVGDPYPAMVTRFNPETGAVNLSIFADQQLRIHKHEQGCRHIDDPDHNEHQKKENGAWELTPETRLLLTMALKNGYGLN